MKSNAVVPARDDVALEQELRDVERVDDVLRADEQRELDRPTGRDVHPAALLGQRLELGVDDLVGLVEVFEGPLELAGDGADLRLRSGELTSTELSVCHETTNMKMTMIVGTTVQTNSATLLPCVWGGSASSVGLRR